MSKVYFLKIHNLIKNQVYLGDSGNQDGGNDGFKAPTSKAGSYELVKYGSRLTVCEVDLTPQIERFEIDYRLVAAIKLPEGFTINMATERKVNVSSYGAKDIGSFDTPLILEEGEWMFAVHDGIRGRYVSRVSDERSVTLMMHEKPLKYGVNGTGMRCNADVHTQILVKAAYAKLFPEGLDLRYMPNEEDVIGVFEKPITKVEIEEANPAWDILKSIKF